MLIERYYTPGQLALETGFPEHEIRAACNRSKAFHPLPHVRSGKKRPVYRICLTDFINWLEDEKVR